MPERAEQAVTLAAQCIRRDSRWLQFGKNLDIAVEAEGVNVPKVKCLENEKQ
jgi:hypothetical protein